MIRRLLIITPQRVFFSTTKSDFEDTQKVRIIDLIMPIELQSEIEEKLRLIDYDSTTDMLQSDITESYRKIFRSISRYAAHERDRIWLFEHGK